MDNTAAQRFDSTKFSERISFQKIWCYRTAPVCCHHLQCITQQRSGFASTKFSERQLQKIWCFRTAMDNTAAQRFDSTKLSKGSPSENLVLSNRPCLLPSFAMDNTAAQRFDSTKFSERKPFTKFGAFEPPWITQQRSGSIAPNFLKKTLHKIWCYRTAHVCCQYSQWITQQRSGSIAPNFLKKTLQKIWCYRTTPLCFQYLKWITQQRSGSIAQNFLKETLQRIWCYRAAPVCCHHLQWITQQRSSSIGVNFSETKTLSKNLVLSNRPSLVSSFAHSLRAGGWAGLGAVYALATRTQPDEVLGSQSDYKQLI